MKIFAVIFIILSSFHSWAATTMAVDPVQHVATITPDFFKPGQKWTWNYFEDGHLYSTERYTVLEASPHRVLIEMSTRLAGESSFKVHHRQEVNPERCLRAYQNPADFRPYSLKLYYLQNGVWNEVDGLSTNLVFEEKFNCDPFVHQDRYRQTLSQEYTTALGSQTLFQQRKGTKDDSSWYFNTSELPGIMGYKKMSQTQDKTEYHIEFSSEQ